MRAVLERERGQLDTLSVRLRTATSVREALACQLEIERVKRATEIALLRIQADAARRAGRTALAGQLEASIREIESPPVRGVPVSRPAPAARSADRSATR